MRLLRDAHLRLHRTALGDLALALNLRLGLLRLRRNVLGKRLPHPGLGGGIGRDSRHGSCNDRGRHLGRHGRRRNNGGKAGVVNHPLRQLLVGANAHHRLVDRRRSSLAGHDGLLWSEGIDRQQQREQHSADKQEITRHGHRSRSPRASTARFNRLTGDTPVSSYPTGKVQRRRSHFRVRERAFDRAGLNSAGCHH